MVGSLLTAVIAIVPLVPLMPSDIPERAISVVAVALKFYWFAYDRGHRHGTHSGFSQGLFAAQERMNRSKPILARKLSI